MPALFEPFQPIKAMFFDVDGVMTNNEILLTEEGQFLRIMNVRDGLALKLAIQAGYRLVVISGGRSEAVRFRLQSLGISDIFLGIDDKMEVYNRVKSQYGLSQEEILYLGDDLLDYQIMQRCGVPCCPADAVEEILAISHYISPYGGGKGCVRDVIEKVMRVQGTWPKFDQ